MLGEHSPSPRTRQANPKIYMKNKKQKPKPINPSFSGSETGTP